MKQHRRDFPSRARAIFGQDRLSRIVYPSSKHGYSRQEAELSGSKVSMPDIDQDTGTYPTTMAAAFLLHHHPVRRR